MSSNKCCDMKYTFLVCSMSSVCVLLSVCSSSHIISAHFTLWTPVWPESHMWSFSFNIKKWLVLMFETAEKVLTVRTFVRAFYELFIFASMHLVWMLVNYYGHTLSTWMEARSQSQMLNKDRQARGIRACFL